jgi:threonine dehydrogenase-like Zn-dependent dehydrogenase
VQQLMLDGPGAVRWTEAPDVQLSSADAAVVRSVAVATCDLDVAVLKGRFPLEGPYPFGHEGVAEVVEVGDGVRSVAVGDIVVVPFQISCGRCAPCARGRTGNCAAHPPLSTFGLGPMGGLAWGGLLADLTLVPHADAMLVRLPESIDPATAASVSDNIADAWRTVGPQLEQEPGGEVLVIGGDGGPNSIGLYAAGLAVALDASRVVYADQSSERLAIAGRFGAETREGSLPRKIGAFPITVDASGDHDGLRCALNSTAFDGTCTSPSVYLTDPPMPLLAMYSRCCTFHTGRAHARPAIDPVLTCIAAGFDPSIVTSAVVTWDEAPEALADPPMKLVVTRL